jgi:hypothetical protein
MTTATPDDNRRDPSEELDPALCDAVQRILNDPMPPGLTARTLEAARRGSAGYPKRPAHRMRRWSVAAIAASIALVVLIAHFRAGERPGDQAGTPPEPAAHENVATAELSDLPTAWAYTQAARQSPEALEALLDRQVRALIAANRQLPPEESWVRSIGQTL